MSSAIWRRPRLPIDREDYEVTPEWAIFHLVEYAAGRAFQISSLKVDSGTNRRVFAYDRRGL